LNAAGSRAAMMIGNTRIVRINRHFIDRRAISTGGRRVVMRERNRPDERPADELSAEARGAARLTLPGH
jgi:hypothetical protein